MNILCQDAPTVLFCEKAKLILVFCRFAMTEMIMTANNKAGASGACHEIRIAVDMLCHSVCDLQDPLGNITGRDIDDAAQGMDAVCGGNFYGFDGICDRGHTGTSQFIALAAARCQPSRYLFLVSSSIMGEKHSSV